MHHRYFSSRVLLIFTLILLATSPLLAETPVVPQPWVLKRIVIIQSTRDYKQARITANDASKKLGLALKLRDLLPNKKTGLSYPEKTCSNDGFEFPCYISRGRYDDGAYVSIEHSNAFEGFAKGYYIVVIASASDKSALIHKSLNNAKKYYKDAYAKRTRVFTGCIH